jgi:hypothetical protein
MRNPSIVTISAAIALVLASGTCVAQDKPNSTSAKKPNASATTASKAPKATAQMPAQSNSSTAKALGERNTPAANRVAPTTDRADDSCHHGKDSDA